MNSPRSAPKPLLPPDPDPDISGSAPGKVSRLTTAFGSGLFSGFAPFASGTVGSAVGLAIYWIPGFENPEWIIPVTALVLFFGVIASTRLEKVFGRDPAQVTIDEVVGMWISLLLLPKSLLLSIAAFVFFRVLDVVKPPPARAVERLQGGAGIMLDDVVAGIYTNLILRVLITLGLF